MTNLADVEQISHHQKNAEIIARLERLPVSLWQWTFLVCLRGAECRC